MRVALVLVLVLLAAVACGGGSDSGDATSPTVESTGCPPLSPLSPDTHTISIPTSAGITVTLKVELADTGDERHTGLMGRTCLPEDSGMIFAFPADTDTSFYMQDTVIPLSVAFIQADGKIVHIEDMQPETTNLHKSPVRYRYAIEMEQGWFSDNGVAVGDIADVPAMLSANAAS